MAFSNLTYLNMLAGTLAGSDVVHKLCLVAPLEVVRERLRRRAEAEGMPMNLWALKRAETRCDAHRSPAFGCYGVDRRDCAKYLQAGSSSDAA